jgi:hypothetical protein
VAYFPKCSCQAKLDENGKCIEGCSDFKKPHVTRRRADKKLSERERKSNSRRDYPTYKQVDAAAKRILPNNRRRFGSFLGDS